MGKGYRSARRTRIDRDEDNRLPLGRKSRVQRDADVSARVMDTRVCVRRRFFRAVVAHRSVVRSTAQTPRQRPGGSHLRRSGFFLSLLLACISQAATLDQTQLPNATWLFQQPWRSISPSVAVEKLSVDGAEIWSPIDSEYACGAARVLTKISEVRNGQCQDCLRLEFFPRSDGRYELRSVLMDEALPTRSQAISFVKRALIAAGVPAERVETITAPASGWQFQWIADDEYRAITVDITLQRHLWLIHLSHLRETYGVGKGGSPKQ